MIYKYVAYQTDGKITSGSVDAENAEQAEQLLESSHLGVISLDSTLKKSFDLKEQMPSFFGVKTKDIILFSRQLATLLEAGVPLLGALELLMKQAGKSALAGVLADVIADLRLGSALSDALGRHPLAFQPLYVHLIQVGEMMGALDRVLVQVAAYLEHQESVSGKTKKALAYPVMVLLMSFGVAALMIVVTLPSVISMFEQFNTALPPTTQFLLALLGFMQRYGVLVALAHVLIIVAGILYIRTSVGRRRWDYILLRMPVLGRIVAYSALARICRTAAILIRGGVPLLGALDQVKQVTGNVVMRDALQRVRQDLALGRGLAEPMSRIFFFPPMMITMVRIGEESGTLDSNLDAVAAFLERDFEERTDFLISLLEPGLTIVVGVIIAFIAVAVIMPMFSLTASVR